MTISEFVLASQKCPSDCWEFSEVSQKCEAKDDVKCFDLNCAFNAMKLVFSSDLFGVTDNQNSNPFGDISDPSFDVSTGQWNLDCPLGECGMTVSTREINSESHLVFTYTLGTSQTGIMVNGEEIFLGDVLSATVNFECAYKSEVKVSSSDFNVNALDAAGKAIKYGSLSDGFSLNLFTDHQMTKMVDTEILFIGQPIYASVQWKLTSLINLVNFYINSCDVEFGGSKTLRIIDDNCYATTFGTKQLQSDKVVQQQAMFQFTSFIVGQGARSMKMKLTCSLKACSVAENKCNVNISAADVNCPNVPAFAYKANTY